MKHMAGAVDVNAVGKREDKTYDRSGKTCFSCGKAGHFSRDPCCPARGRKCSNCSMYGHFAVCCQSLNRHTADKGGESRFKKASSNTREFKSQANQVEDYVEGSGREEENPAFAFSVLEEIEEGVCRVSASSDVPTMNVSIDGIVKEVLMDSGSVSNLMGEEDFQKLKSAGLKGDIEHCSRKLIAYGGSEIDVIGQFEAGISVGNAKVTSSFVVAKCGRCILGNVIARELGVLHIRPKASFVGGNCNEVKSDFADQLKAQYPEASMGLGKLKDFELKLHVNPDVPPVAQKLRRVPFALN